MSNRPVNHLHGLKGSVPCQLRQQASRHCADGLQLRASPGVALT